MALNQTQLLLLQHILMDLKENPVYREVRTRQLCRIISRRHREVSRQLEQTMEG